MLIISLTLYVDIFVPVFMKRELIPRGLKPSVDGRLPSII